MIYDLSKKITYCSAKDINHATSISIQIVASALKKSASKQRDAAL